MKAYQTRIKKIKPSAAAPMASLALALALLGASGCATVKSVFGVNPSSGSSGTIHNPFGDQYAAGGSGDRSQNLILRTKKGDRSVEIELPRDSQSMTDFTIPISPAFREANGGGRRGLASVGGDSGYGASSGYGANPNINNSVGSDNDSGYTKLPPSMADHEITRAFPQSAPAQEGDRRAIEEGLGVMASEDSIPAADESYLGALDHVKGLYRQGRYEAGLVELDALIRQYPTSPKLHVMRGTLLDRVGQSELALKSWNQALRLDPKNASLRKFIDRKGNQRSLASP